MKHWAICIGGLFAAALLVGFLPPKTQVVPYQIIQLIEEDVLFVVGEQRKATQSVGIYGFYTTSGKPIGLPDTIKGSGNASLSLTCAKEMGWGMALGGTAMFSSGPQGFYFAARWEDYGSKLGKSNIRAYIPKVESILAIGEWDGRPVLMGKQGSNLLLLTPKIDQHKIKFEDKRILQNWHSIAVAKWLNEEVFVVVGKDHSGQLRVAKINARGEIEADTTPSIDCQASPKTATKTNEPGYRYVILAQKDDFEPVCKPSKYGILEVNDVALSFDNTIALAGSYQSSRNADTDAWFARLSDDLNMVLYETLPEGRRGKSAYDALHAIHMEPYSGDWLLTGTTYSNEFDQRNPDVQVWRVGASEVATPKGRGVTYTYIIAGNQQQPDAEAEKGIVFTAPIGAKEETGKYVFAANNLSLFSAAENGYGTKSWGPIPSLNKTPRHMDNPKGGTHAKLIFKDIVFETFSGNKILGAGKTENITVKAVRSNPSDLSSEIVYTLKAVADKSAIACETKICTLKAGEKHLRIGIPVTAGNITDGTVNFIVYADGEKIGNVSAVSQGKIVVSNKPIIGKIAQGKSTDGAIQIKGEAQVHQKGEYKSSISFKLKNQNSATPKQRTIEKTLKMDDPFGILEFSFEVPSPSDYLTDGENEIEIEIIDPLGDTTRVSKFVNLSINKPHFYGYFFGVPDKSLKYTVNDAKHFANACEKMRTNSSVYSSVDTALFADSLSTTRAALLDVFEKIYNDHKNKAEKSTILIFMSTHGDLWLGSKLRIKASEKDKWIDLQNMIDSYLKPLSNNEIILVLDLCSSGGANIGKNNNAMRDSINHIKLYREGIVLLASSRDTEYSYECGQNGIFTYAILEAIKGHADDDKNGKIDIQELNNYLSNKEYLKDKKFNLNKECNIGQTPTIKCYFQKSDQCPDLNIFSVINQ
jgi:Caspase domain